MKMVKFIALVHTKTTHLICIPAKIIRDMGLENEKNVQIEYDSNTKVLTVTKLKD